MSIGNRGNCPVLLTRVQKIVPDHKQKTPLAERLNSDLFNRSYYFQGKKQIRKHATIGARKSSDMRSRLEDMIMGQNYSNRSEMLSRRGKGGNFTVL